MSKILIAAAGLIAMAFAEAASCDDKKSPAKPGASILSPKDGDEVGKDTVFTVKARVDNVPQGYKVYTSTEVNRLFWPKEENLTQFRPGEDWVADFAEGGGSPEFRLTLLLVPPEGQDVLADWFEKGSANGDFPGLRLDQIKGSQRLDSVKLRIK
jgi:hypothetical protein